MQNPSAKKGVSREVAEKAVNSWLDHKRIRPSRREDLENHIEDMIYAFMDGTFTLNEKTFVITHHLAFPTGEKQTIDFQPRLKAGDAVSRLKESKSVTGDERVMTYVCALTNLNSGIVKALDTEDLKDCQTIAVFFV